MLIRCKCFIMIKNENKEFFIEDIRITDNFLIELYKSKTIQQMSKELKISFGTIRKRLVRNGICIKPNRKYFFNKSIFEKIDCEWKSYYLGLIYADGCVRKSNISLGLQEKDRFIIDILNDIVYNGKFKLIETKEKEYINKKTGKLIKNHKKIGILINSTKVVNDIKKLGCEERKSFILKFPSFDIIPKELFNHFIRGYFDGDGWKSKNTLGIISSDDFCFGLQKFLKQELNIECYLKKCNKVSRILIHKKTDINIFKEYLYANSTIFLKRKFDKF